MDREKTAGATIVVDFYGGVAGLVASRVFSRLGVSAIVLEGFANAVGGTGRTNLDETIERVARIVPTVDAAFGAVVGPEAEYVQFVDDRGELVPPDVMLACLIDQLHSQNAVFRETPLSTVRQKFGDSFGHLVRERLECPWSAKGRVMRGLAERFGRDPDAILAEGV